MRRKAKNIELDPRQRIAQKKFKKAFVPNGEEIKVKVNSCIWNSQIVGHICNTVQIGFDYFLAVDYQKKETPWLRFVFLRENIEILKNETN